MSDADVDSIIKKYDRNLQRLKPDYSQTQRKKENRDAHMITFMDNAYTPMKEARPSSQELVRIEEILKQLDESQKRYAVSERNYAQICRKYDKLKQTYDILSNELEKQRKGRLQQLIDTQNKLHLFETDSKKNQSKLQSKDQTIAILKQKLIQKQQQVAIFEEQLEQISRKLYQTFEMKNKQQKGMINYGLQVNKEQSQRQLQLLREKYERSFTTMSSQIQNFAKDLAAKEKEKKTLLIEMEEMSKKHISEVKEIKDALLKNEEQYKLWLDESKKEKLDLIQKYEQQIREFRKVELFDKLHKSDNQIEDTVRSKSMLRELEQKNQELQTQIKVLKLDIQNGHRNQKSDEIKINSLRQQIQNMKSEYMHQICENKKLLNNLKQEQEKIQKQQKLNYKNEVEIQSLRIKNNELQSQNKIQQKQIEKLKADMQKELKSLLAIKKQLNHAANNEINMNSTLTQTSVKLKQKIQQLEQQLQQTTTQLYAERLQKAKVMQELEQTRVKLKRQYDLSVQNMRRELSVQIKENLHSKTDREVDEQKIYLKMFKLQRQYQLLKSETITSEQMLKMGTKMAKYYQKRVK